MITTSVIQSGLDGIDSIALEPLNYTMPELPYTLLDKNYIRLVGMPSDNPEPSWADPDNYLFDNSTDWNGNVHIHTTQVRIATLVISLLIWES